MLSKLIGQMKTLESYMMSREDSKLIKLTLMKLSSSSAELRERAWEKERFHTLLLTMEELSDTPSLISRNMIQLR